MINLNDKHFKGVQNTENGQVSGDTLFHYRQKGKVVWATYEGGQILFGTLSGRITGTQLEFDYQHQNLKGEFLTGHCISQIKISDTGKISLYEKWQWTCGDRSKGESIVEEM